MYSILSKVSNFYDIIHYTMQCTDITCKKMTHEFQLEKLIIHISTLNNIRENATPLISMHHTHR